MGVSVNVARTAALATCRKLHRRACICTTLLIATKSPDRRPVRHRRRQRDRLLLIFLIAMDDFAAKQSQYSSTCNSSQ
jgi:hypothetical protein